MYSHITDASCCQMNQWSRVSNRHGQTLLSLAFNYGVLSLMTLTFGIARLEVNLEDRPHGCFAALSEEQKIDHVMHHMLRDFKSGAEEIQLVDDERVCYQASVRGRCLWSLSAPTHYWCGRLDGYSLVVWSARWLLIGGVVG